MPLNLEALEAARIAVGLSQADISRRMGVSRGTVSRWFSGDGEPETVERLRKLAEELGTTLASLVGEDAAMSDKEKLLLQAFRQLGPLQGEAAIALLASMTRRD